MGSNGSLQYFWLRRLHSLLGIAPIGAFVIEHFWSNSYVFDSPAAYDGMVRDLQSMPLMVLLEIGLIGLPIFFHVVLGLVIVYTGANNFLRYNHYRNWMYFLQRVTGVFALFFIAYHVWETRIASAMRGQTITFQDVTILLSEPWAPWAYAIGILSVCFHFANGISTSLITWGITGSMRSQRAASLACWGFFVVMSAWGLLILREFI